jgi:hypothetical protein
MQKKIEIEYRDVAHTGYYSVDGTSERRIVVYYKGHRRVDSFDSRAEQPGYVESFAKQLLVELVED